MANREEKANPETFIGRRLVRQFTDSPFFIDGLDGNSMVDLRPLFTLSISLSFFE